MESPLTLRSPLIISILKSKSKIRTRSNRFGLLQDNLPQFEKIQKLSMATPSIRAPPLTSLQSSVTIDFGLVLSMTSFKMVVAQSMIRNILLPAVVRAAQPFQPPSGLHSGLTLFLLLTDPDPCGESVSNTQEKHSSLCLRILNLVILSMLLCLTQKYEFFQEEKWFLLMIDLYLLH